MLAQVEGLSVLSMFIWYVLRLVIAIVHITGCLLNALYWWVLVERIGCVTHATFYSFKICLPIMLKIMLGQSRFLLRTLLLGGCESYLVIVTQ